MNDAQSLFLFRTHISIGSRNNFLSAAASIDRRQSWAVNIYIYMYF